MDTCVMMRCLFTEKRRSAMQRKTVQGVWWSNELGKADLLVKNTNKGGV